MKIGWEKVAATVGSVIVVAAIKLWTIAVGVEWGPQPMAVCFFTTAGVCMLALPRLGD
jgi:hypothetical protein